MSPPINGYFCQWGENGGESAQTDGSLGYLNPSSLLLGRTLT